MSNTPMEWLWQYAMTEIENADGNLDKAVSSLEKKLIEDNDVEFIHALTHYYPVNNPGRTLTEACQDAVWGASGMLCAETAIRDRKMSEEYTIDDKLADIVINETIRLITQAEWGHLPTTRYVEEILKKAADIVSRMPLDFMETDKKCDELRVRMTTFEEHETHDEFLARWGDDLARRGAAFRKGRQNG